MSNVDLGMKSFLPRTPSVLHSVIDTNLRNTELFIKVKEYVKAFADVPRSRIQQTAHAYRWSACYALPGPVASL